MGCRVVTTKLLTTHVQGSQKLTLSRFNTYEITSRHRTTVFFLNTSLVLLTYGQRQSNVPRTYARSIAYWSVLRQKNGQEIDVYS